MTDEKVDELPATAIAAYRQIPTNLAVGTAIEGISGCQVLPLKGDGQDSELLSRLCQAAATC